MDFRSRDIEGDSILYVLIRLGTVEGRMSFILYPYYCRLDRIELGVPKGGVPTKLYMIVSPTKPLFPFGQHVLSYNTQSHLLLHCKVKSETCCRGIDRMNEHRPTLHPMYI